MIKKNNKYIWIYFKNIIISNRYHLFRGVRFFSFLSWKSNEHFVKNTCTGCGSLYNSTFQKYYSENNLNEGKFVSKFKNFKRQEEDRIFNYVMANLDETLSQEFLETVSEKHLSKFFQEKPQKRLLCPRCHNLIHHSTLSTEFLTLSETLTSSNWVSTLLKEKNALIIHIIDSIDFPHSYIQELHNLFGKRFRIFYVVNKIDIICERKAMLRKVWDYFLPEISKLVQTTKEELIPYVILTSAIKGWGINQLITSINKYTTKNSNVYFIGMINVGKSSVVSKIVSQVDYKETPTVSFLPNTTINPISININKLGNLFENGGKIIDTPGIFIPERQLFKYVDHNKLKIYVPKKKFPKINSFTMKAGQALIIESIIRIDYPIALNTNNRLIITPHTFLPIHLTNIKKAEQIFKNKVNLDTNNINNYDNTLLENQTKEGLRYNMVENINHKEHKDIVIAGFGWISMKTNYGNQKYTYT
ncbi:hypothetical protein PCANB_000939 [Pneumocystis canis]|nr:hypothetical protein PCANB_000939 [Pneumocystis canis]